MYTILSIIILILLIVVITILTLLFIKKKKIYFIITASLLLIYFVYSFFSDIGSVKLSMLIMGKPIAYITTFSENEKMHNDNNKYYKPNDNIETVSGRIGYFECKRIGILRFSKYYGY